jgi:leucyl aminopeptidase
MLTLTSRNPAKLPAEVLILPVCSDAEIHATPALKGLAAAALAAPAFEGRKGDVHVRHAPEGLPAERVICVGLGEAAKVTAEDLRQAAGRGVKAAWERRRAVSAVLAAPCAGTLPVAADRLLESLCEGALLANHRFDRYKAEARRRPLKAIQVLVDRAAAARHRGLAARVATICRATTTARDWVSMPSNDKRPETLARQMARAGRSAGLAARVLDARRLRRLGMGALLAVAAGSRHEPRLVILENKAPPGAPRVVLVGKGVTFDAGGYNLKPTGSIEGMKADMAGAAAVAAALTAAARLGSPLHLIGVIPLVENMISGDAYRPGDVVRTYAGKTVEIGNTDAEGRLILIDAMAYAVRTFKPRYMVDMATLTGACVVALGERLAGVLSDDEALREAILAAGRETFERCWPLPLPEDYRELLDSDVADLRNVGPHRWGGALLAGLFLAAFAKGTRWAHIDIAGPAFAQKAQAYCEPGGTGFGVRLLCRLLDKLAQFPEGGGTDS